MRAANLAKSASEDDGLFEVIERDIRIQGTTQFHFDLSACKAQIEAEHSKIDALLQIRPIPEEAVAVSSLDKDE